MEQPLDYRDDNNLILENDGKAALKTASKWAKFVAISGLILFSVALIGTLVSLIGLSRFVSVNPFAMLLYFGAILMACVWVFQFARKASSAINECNASDLTLAMRYLRNLFILQGIIIILVLVTFIVIGLIIVIYSSNF